VECFLKSRNEQEANATQRPVNKRVPLVGNDRKIIDDTIAASPQCTLRRPSSEPHGATKQQQEVSEASVK
jgi:hypothetical protein